MLIEAPKKRKELIQLVFFLICVAVVVRRRQSGILTLAGGLTGEYHWRLRRGAVVNFSAIYEYSPNPSWGHYIATLRLIYYEMHPVFEDPNNHVDYIVRFTNPGGGTARFRLGIVTFREE